MGLFEELQGLDFNDIGSWTRRVKLFMAVILSIGILVAGYYLVIKDQIAELETVKKKEPQLKQTFMEKKALAINLDAYRLQMVEADKNFGVLRKQLPDAVSYTHLTLPTICSV